MSEAIPDDLIGTREARTLTGITYPQLMTLVRYGHIRSYKQGYALLVSRGDLLREMSQRSTIVPRPKSSTTVKRQRGVS